LLYVKNSLQATVYEPSVSFPEQIWCNISSPSADTIHIGVCYRTPNSDIFGTDNHDTIRALLNEMGTGKHHCVLMGDFNYSIIHWPPLHEDSCSLDTRQFYDCLDDNFFSQHVSFPTRKDSILDLVITDEPYMVSDLTDLGPLGTSNHHAVLWKLPVSHILIESK